MEKEKERGRQRKEGKKGGKGEEGVGQRNHRGMRVVYISVCKQMFSTQRRQTKHCLTGFPFLLGFQYCHIRMCEKDKISYDGIQLSYFLNSFVTSSLCEEKKLSSRDP